MGWVVGAVINVIGSIMINLGTNLTKLGHNKTAAAAPLEAPSLRKSPKEWFKFPGKKWFSFGMTVFITGNVLNFASFGFAAQSLLAALGVVQFLSNMVFARFLNHEHITRRVMFATALVVAGCVLLVSFGNHESPIVTGRELLAFYAAGPYIAYLVVMAVTVVVTYLIYRRGKKSIGGLKVQKTIQGPWRRWLPVCYALFSGLLGTQSVLYGKTLSMLLRTTLNGDSQLGFWYTWLSLVLFIFFAAFWLTRYSKALRLFPVTLIMPILQIVWVLFSIVSGSLYYQEYKSLDALSGSMFGLGVVIMLVGIGFLTGGGSSSKSDELIELQEELVVEGDSSLDTTPTHGKLFVDSNTIQGSLRHKYSSQSQEDVLPVAADMPSKPTHGKQASDDVGLRLFSGESSSATVWDSSLPQGDLEGVVKSSNKRPALRVVVEASAGEEDPSSGSAAEKQSMLEENDMDANFKQFARGFAGVDYQNPLSPAFTSFSMPLVPAVCATPRPLPQSHPLSARGAPQATELVASRGKHRLQRSRSASELGQIMAEIEAGTSTIRVGGSPPPRRATSPVRSPDHSRSMAALSGTPFDVPSPQTSAETVTPQLAPVSHLSRSGGSAPRLGTLGSGGTRRSWSMMSERGTPVPPLPLNLSPAVSHAESGDMPTSTSSTRPPRINPLSPRAFLEPLSPHSEEITSEDLSRLMSAQKGKHE